MINSAPSAILGRYITLGRGVTASAFRLPPSLFELRRTGRLTHPAAFRLETVALLPHQWHVRIIVNDGHRLRHVTPRTLAQHFPTGVFFMRRATALSAAAGIIVSALAVISPAQAGHYLLLLHNTAPCQDCNHAHTR